MESYTSLQYLTRSTELQHICNTHQQTKQSVLYRVVPVMLHSRNKPDATFAFLDKESSLTLPEEGITIKLELSTEIERLCLK